MIKNTIILGDLHGSYSNLRYEIDKYSIKDTLILQVGDFGIGFSPLHDDEIMKFNSNFFKERNIEMWVIRGNHDYPKFFDGKHDYENIKFLPDYSIREVNDHKILFVGGAISIDRKMRLNRMTVDAAMGRNSPQYWYDEGFVLDLDKVKDLKDITCVITHNAPNWASPFSTSGLYHLEEYFEKDPSLKDCLIKERNDITQLFEYLLDNGNPITKHYYGHYHRDDISEYRGITSYLLGIGSKKELI